MERRPITGELYCLVIDDFLLNPHELIDYAAAHAAGFFMQERAYPGKILSMDESIVGELHAFVRSRLSREFSFLRGGIEKQTQLSLTTLLPEDFTWIQQLPHSDPKLGAGRANYAALLYLFENPDLGGTGFYRWKDPEFWRKMTALQVDDPDGGLDILRERYRMFREPPAYTTESNDAVELLGMVPAKFNRMIAYSGDLPHNAFVTNPELLRDDMRTGRLTLNCFASVWPR